MRPRGLPGLLANRALAPPEIAPQAEQAVDGLPGLGASIKARVSSRAPD